MNKITFQIRLSPGGTHIAQAVENGKVIAVSTKGYTNGEEAIQDVTLVLVEKRAPRSFTDPKESSHANPTDQPND